MAKPSAENRTSRALRTILQRSTNELDLDAPEMCEVLVGLEYFLPDVLAEIYPYWKGESFDGFFLSNARKLGTLKAELIGLAILISDQTLTPFHLRLRVSSSEDQIDWMEFKVGARDSGAGNMLRTPWPWSQRDKMLHSLKDQLGTIDWVYRITFGEKKSG